MANIFISLSGEGRGHATRVRAVVESLRHEHKIHLFASGDAFQFLRPHYEDSEVRVQRIAGLRFHYTPEHRLDFTRTGFAATRFARRLPSLVRMLGRRIESVRPDLVIADFEPALPRAAKNCGVPFISLDHQHFLTTYDLGSLPLKLRLHAAFMALVVRAYFQGQRENVVSSFYFPPLRRGVRNTTQVGVMLRPEIVAAESTNQGHLVAYWRRTASDRMLDALRDTGREVRVYGLGARPSSGNLQFQAIDERRFIEDLASCDALVSTAGNQLVGEALNFGKAVFVVPEERNFEQYINGHFLAQSGAGEWCEMREFDGRRLNSFLAQVDAYKSRICPDRMNGLPGALAAIRRHLPGSSVPARELVGDGNRIAA
ncbi:MAG TPA: glycosyltransferase family protein [Candidatus Limnocylindria bacterium]|nr:glycosyltransferase family protein [Candidatus Limnocylindria bacterium]